ncbi:MAG: hypothetical protein AAFN59_08530 [Pseudomonadota bacterium]
MSPEMLLDLASKSIALFVPACAAFFCLRLALRSQGSLALAGLMTCLMAMVALAGMTPWALGPEPAPIPSLVLALIAVAYAGPLCRSKVRRGQVSIAKDPVADTFMADLKTAPPTPVVAFASKRERVVSRPVAHEPSFRHRPASRPVQASEIPADVLIQAERRHAQNQTQNQRPKSVRIWFEDQAANV